MTPEQQRELRYLLVNCHSAIIPYVDSLLAAERARCAKIADDAKCKFNSSEMDLVATQIAAAIRAEVGEKP